jgi:hypothetical protein
LGPASAPLHNEGIFCSLLIVAACVAAYLALASVFEGVGKGTAMIVILLFAMLNADLSRS